MYFVLRSAKNVFVFDQQGLYFLLKLSCNWERHVRITTIYHKFLLINVLIDSGTTRRLHFKSFPAISIFNIIHYYVHLVLHSLDEIESSNRTGRKHALYYMMDQQLWTVYQSFLYELDQNVRCFCCSSYCYYYRYSPR